MSNPYDPYNNPQQPEQPSPYGQPYGQGGGQGGYGGGYGAPYGDGSTGGNQPQGTDGLSIAAFVLSLTCCLSIVGLILGFFGLKRTKDGRRKGRWAAIAAIPLGILGTLALVGGIIGLVYVANHTVTPDNAEAGQCVDVNSEDGNIGLWKKECTEKHDAEIFYVGEAGEDASTLESTSPVDICLSRISDDTDLVGVVTGGDYEISAVIEDPEDVSTGDKFVCYVEATSGDLDAPIQG